MWILPAGAHGALEAIDSKFTYNVYRGFFERWGRYAELRRGRWQVARGGLLRFAHRVAREESEWTRSRGRLIWAGLLAATGALATVAAHRLSEVIYLGSSTRSLRVSDEPTLSGSAPPPTAPARSASNGGRAPEEMTVGELVFEVSDRATVLVREEIELAKTEVTEKLTRLLQGGVTAVVAGVFLLAALAIMHGIAWLLNDLFFDDDVWAGFLVEAAFFLLLAAIEGLFAYRSFRQAPADAGHGDRGGGDQGELRERERGR